MYLFLHDISLFCISNTMTCVWRALLHGLRNDSDATGLIGEMRTEPNLVRALMSNNGPTPDVLWQGQHLSNQSQKENQMWIRDYDVDSISGGHLVSMADPFMILLCQLLNISIVHNGKYGSVTIGTKSPRYTITLASDGGHMWA